MFKSFEVTAYYAEGKETRRVTINAAGPETAAKLAITQRLLPVDFMPGGEPRYWTDTGDLEIVKTEAGEGTHVEMNCRLYNNPVTVSLQVSPIS